jgi:hypothetical protein
MQALVQGPQPEIRLVALCFACPRRHEYRCTALDLVQRMSDWEQKHPRGDGHLPEYHIDGWRTPRGVPRAMERVWEEANEAPWWLAFPPNADIKLAYVASGTYTMTLASLASSATLVAGRESAAVSNTTNLYLDYLLGGKVRMGTTVTAGTLELWGIAAVNDTPTYPDVFAGADAAKTVTTADIKRAALKLLWTAPNDTTNSRDYWWSGISLAAAFGGLVPANHGLFFVHSAVAALDATEGNHNKSYRAAYLTSA